MKLLRILGVALVAALALAGPLRAEGPWEPVPNPDTRGGLVLSPRLKAVSGRIQMIWGWTNEQAKIKEPEFTYASFDGNSWTVPRPPYFGDNYGRVRRLAMGSARNVVGAIFQRTMDQDDKAFEVRYALSGDGGWSYSDPATADSFVHEGTTGTAVAIAGIGGRKPTFALAWLTEAKFVRAGVLDPLNNSDRPRANNVGQYGNGCERVELSGEDGSGFVVVWSDGAALRSARLKPLIGDPEESLLVARGKTGMNFALTDWKGKRPILVYETAQTPAEGGSRRQVATWKGGSWAKVPVAPPPGGEPEFPESLQAVQDEEGNLYVASLTRGGDAIRYQTSRGGKWSAAEVAIPLNEQLPVTGYDLAVHDGFVYVVASQGPHLHFVRRKVEG